MPDDFEDPSEIIVAPIAAMIEKIGASVADASRDLLEAQLENMANVPPAMAAVGLQPVLYHMQSVEVELRLAFHLQFEEIHDPSAADGRVKRFFKGLTGAPINNGYTKGQTFDVNGASNLRMQFAPGPPPNEWGGENGT